MSKIWEATKQLWKNAPIWRNFLIVAVLSTFGSLLLSLFFSKPSASTSSATLGCPDPNNPSCKQSTTTACPSKFNKFITNYQAVKAMIDEGRKCEILANYASNVDQCPTASQQEQQQFVEATSCIFAIQDSNERFERIKKNYDAFQGNQNISNETAFLKACQGIIKPFDTSRAAFKKMDIMQHCDKQAEKLKKSELRIKRFVFAHDELLVKQDALSENNLLTTIDAIELEDEKRMNKAEYKQLITGRKLKQHVEQCKTRLNIFQSKFRLAQTNVSEEIYFSLLDALDDVTRMKKKGYTCEVIHASVELQGDIKNAYDLLQKRNVELLKKKTSSVDFCMQPDIDLYELIEKLHRTLPPQSPLKFPIADRVVSVIEDSNQRLNSLLRIAKSWKQNPKNALSSVQKIYQSINSFDQGRFKEAHQQAWGNINVAYDILNNKNPKAVTYFVEVIEDNKKATTIKARFSEKLIEKGLKTTKIKDNAGMVIQLQGGISSPDQGGNQRVSLTLSSIWNFTNDDFYSDNTSESVFNSALKQYGYHALINTLFDHFYSEVIKVSKANIKRPINRSIPLGNECH